MQSNALIDLALKAYHLVIPPRVDREVKRAMSTPQLQFPSSVTLPKAYGVHMSERVVEILLARLTYKPGKRILDVGHANAINAHLRMLDSLTKPLDITGIDITPAADAVLSHYTHSVVGNIMKSDFPADTFDLIWCISALEHFGMDNSVYTDQFVLDTEMDIKALGEMVRILRPGGTVYVSVPFGKLEDHQWHRNYGKERWQKLLDVARPSARIDELYFKYSDGAGWSTVNAEELAHVGYFDQKNRGASGLAVALIHKLKP